MKKLILFLFLLTTFINAQTVWYVNKTAAGSNNGLTPQNAYTSIDSVLKKNLAGGSKIFIYPGFYKPSVDLNATGFGAVNNPVDIVAAGQGVMIGDSATSRQYMFNDANGKAYINFYNITFYRAKATNGKIYLFRGYQYNLYDCFIWLDGSDALVCTGTYKIGIYNSVLQVYSAYTNITANQVVSRNSTFLNNGSGAWFSYTTLGLTKSIELKDVYCKTMNATPRLIMENGITWQSYDIDKFYYNNCDITGLNANGTTVNVSSDGLTYTRRYPLTPSFTYTVATTSELFAAGRSGQDVGFLSNFGIKVGQ